MKKIFSLVVFISALILVSGVVSAATANKPTPTPVKYTAEQQTCIKDAQSKRAAAIKTAQDALNATTKDALQKRQDAIKAAQSIKDAKARTAAIKAATEAYNNDATVKQAKPPYITVVKAANDQFQIDQKACLAGMVGEKKGFFKNIGNSIGNASSGFWYKITHLFSKNK